MIDTLLPLEALGAWSIAAFGAIAVIWTAVMSLIALMMIVRGDY